MNPTAIIYKKPLEVFPVGFRYRAPDLAAGVTITVVDVTVTAGLTEGTNGIMPDGTEVYCWLSGGTSGTDYTVRFKSTLSDSKVLIDDFLVKVRD